MAESQPGYQDFLQWKASPDIRKRGCRGSDATVGPTYISQVALEERLTRKRIELLLKEISRDWDQPALNAEYVRTHYLRPFAILLSVGYGYMITHVVEHQSLRDRYLPFFQEPEGFPKSTACNLFQKFYEEQWQFCAVKLEFDMNYRLENDYILPIHDKTRIGHGGSAVLYKIDVDDTYNALVPDEHTNVVSQPLYRRLMCPANQMHSQRHDRSRTLLP